MGTGTALDIVDGARGAILRGVMRTGLGGVVRRRSQRATLRAAVAIGVAFLFAWSAPAAALAVSPLLLGVPHIASSVRYLVLRQGFSMRAKGLIVGGAVVLLAARVFEQYGSAVGGTVGVAARIEVGAGVVWALAAAAAGARASRSPARLLLVVPVLAIVGIAGLHHPVWMRLAFVHVHNLGAVVAWMLLFRRGRVLLPATMLGVGLLVLGTGLIAPLSTTGLGVDLDVVGRWLAPGLARSAAVPLVLVHVFTDSVHYAFWLGVIPEETLRGEGTLTFRMTWRGLLRDFGAGGLATIACAMAGLGLLACFGAGRARDVYFAVAGWHGYLEGAMIVYLITAQGAQGARGAQGQRPGATSESRCGASGGTPPAPSLAGRSAA